MKNCYTLGILCLSLFLSNLNAQTHQWTGNGGDTNWFNTANWDAGTVPIETSSVQISGNVFVTISGNAAEAFTIDLLNGSTLELESDLTTGSIITIDPNSTLEFISGTLSGSGVHNNGLLKLTGEFSRTFDNTSITNNALFLVTNSNQTQVLGTTINNSSTGVIDIASVGGFLQQSTTSILNNEGFVVKSPDGLNPVGNFYLILEINNEGTIEVQEDQIFLLLAGGDTFTNFETGRVTGDGTYDITTTFINEGTVSPGSSGGIGTLDITNNFSLNGGIVAIDILGNQPGEFDAISVFGSPLMEGIFEINLQFAPQIGDEFPVLTWSQSGSSCSFPQFTTAIFEGMEYTFETFCNANDVTLRLAEISVLGLDDFSKSEVQFYVYPNPVSGEATFVFSSERFSSEETTLSIYNYLGQRVLNVDGFTSETNTFQRGDLPAGLYFASIAAEGQVIATTQLLLD